MNRLRIRCRTICLLLAGLLVAAGPWPAHANQPHCDVVIYGATSGGVMAAVQASRLGHSVVLIEPTRRIGGMTTCGLGWTDSGNKAVIGGLAREFYRRIKLHYDRPEAWTKQTADSYGRYRAADDAMWTFEPHVALQLMQQFLKETDVRLLLQQRLDRDSDAPCVTREGARIQTIRLESGMTVAGRMFIDASYEGDLLAAAGVSYTVGREANAKYGESLNGIQTRQNTHSHRFLKAVDPYRRPGQTDSGLLPGIDAAPIGSDGEADQRIQAYCFRMCLSKAEDRLPLTKPDGYDPLRYELLLRNFEAGDLRLPLKNDLMPNLKTDTNNNCAVSTDNIGMNYDYPEASSARREAIFREHLQYQQGLMWTLAHHPRVPRQIRDRMSQWGLSRDEFVDSGHWPPQMYVREARRMVADYVITQQDCMRQRLAPDSVGLGSYNMDSHNVQRYVTADGRVQNEGDVQVSPGGAYLVSYRALTPKQAEAENLLAPVCLSASHIAYGSIRMEPVFMVLGQSAAHAASLALHKAVPVQQVPYALLRQALLADKQVLDLPPNSKPRRLLLASQLPGIVVDDEQAELSGTWTASASVGAYVGRGYRHDGNQAAGPAKATYRFRLRPGRYEVRLSYAPHSNRATKVPVRIHTAAGPVAAVVNQRRSLAAEQAPFVSLGEHAFGEAASVEISNAGADGFVIIDAVQLLPK